MRGRQPRVDMTGLYKRVVLYYFSGTGNALLAARWFAQAAREQGISAEIVPIDRFKKPLAAPPGEGGLTGFFYPTHGFSLPWYMLRFMLAFPAGQRDVFCLNTFGGTKLGRFHLPGLSGLALILPALLFILKGCRVRGLVSLNLPSNWISLHPGLAPATVASLADHCLEKVRSYAASLLAGRAMFRGIVSLPFDVAVIPIALGYTIIGRFWLAKMYMTTTDCDGCGRCATLCPVDALRMKHGHPLWTFHCESCMRCMNICPKKAIQVSHLFTAISAYVLYGLFFPFVVGVVTYVLPSTAAVFASKNLLVGLARAWVVLGMMFLAYRLVQALLRWQPFDFLFARLSLTRLNGWRRYLAPGIGAKDFKAGSYGKNHPGRGRSITQRG